MYSGTKEIIIETLAIWLSKTFSSRQTFNHSYHEARQIMSNLHTNQQFSLNT